jgi:hypothetical protein
MHVIIIIIIIIITIIIIIIIIVIIIIIQKPAMVGSLHFQGGMMESDGKEWVSYLVRGLLQPLWMHRLSVECNSITLSLRSCSLSVGCAYAPTEDYPESQKYQFYSGASECCRWCASQAYVGHFNAQVGAEQPDHWHGCLEKFALKREGLVTQSLATRLLEICCANALVLPNTFFDHQKIRSATWTGPDGRNENLVNN